MSAPASSTDLAQLTRTLACGICGQAHRMPELMPGTTARCVRCGSQIAKNPPNGLHRTAALSLAALLLYWPANVFPILSIQQNGARSESTVMGSVRLLWEAGDPVIALIVLAASIVVPLVKLAGLFYLSASTQFASTRNLKFRTSLFRGIEVIGKWAMLDVFVLGLLVSVVKLRGLATVNAEPGALPFASVVLLTLFATASFDPQLIWKNAARKS